MENDLFVALRKYRPPDDRDPLENFITDAFAWTLNTYPGFGVFFMQEIISRLDRCDVEVSENPEWRTQGNFDHKRPDMFCTVSENAFLFENKAWGNLEPHQLDSYRACADGKFPGKYHLILITGSTNLHDQEPDLALCWYTICDWIESYLKNPEIVADNHFILRNFLELLKHEGMGKAG